MSDHAAGDHGHHDIHPPSHYVRIWGILLTLLLVSFIGPWFGHQIVTLVTAFGIAFVKAYLVIKHFMHLDVEKPIVHYFLVTSVVFMVLLFAGVSPDVMHHEGTNWSNMAAEAEIARALSAQEASGGEHGEHGAGAAEHKPAEHKPAGGDH